MSQTRQLVANLFTDIVGYTVMTQTDEQKAVGEEERILNHSNTQFSLQ